MRMLNRSFSLLAGLALTGCGRTELRLEPPLGSDAGGATGADASVGGAPPEPTCEQTRCGRNERCEPSRVTCVCLPGFSREGPAAPCLTSAQCKLDRDCDDGDLCNGDERCRDAVCQPGTAFECPEREQCVATAVGPGCGCALGYFPNASGVCLPACEVPLAPVISIIDEEETLHFKVAGDLPIQTAIQAAALPATAAVYLPLSDISLAAHRGGTRVLARVVSASCTPVTVFDAVYDVRETCAPPGGTEGTTAIGGDDPLIEAWATGVQSYEPGAGATVPQFMDPTAALGSAVGSDLSVVALGDAGELTLSFEPPITDGDAWDFAVFENAFNDAFLELGFVEVSSDGTNFSRFDSAFRGEGPTSAGYAGDATRSCGFAGTYSAKFGTPFDLEALRNQPLVRSGVVDLNAIRYVRVIDVVGDGNTRDSFGRPIFDPSPSSPNAGFDANGVGVLHRAVAP
jgi:hypothetical protein